MAIRIDHEGLWNGDTLIIPRYIDNGTVLDRQVQVESSLEDLTRVTLTIATVEEVTIAEQYGKQVPL
ncbi:MAG: hypothetical protein L0L18_00115 [Acidipropionibacterium jensenii]|uniref:hypothetical protein n=1 Tax=Corynebacterium variabile TaxID=1727 RepID=UPI002647A3BC|nr:hypothetical protein [Corynebacterium variabile]MDN6657425.1 hypothetical protein [Acidipropionibacterium jensenii]MDN6676770.1 hypothetical protein [Corynebacterium variabile]